MLVAIDELQALPAVDYARLVGELRKYGAGFLLATQTLAGLDRLDPTLRPLLLGNCEALLGFRTSAEEAALLARELDGLVTAADLTNLERGCAYLKASERGQPAPATWLRVHPPAARTSRWRRRCGRTGGRLGRAGRGGGGAGRGGAGLGARAGRAEPGQGRPPARPAVAPSRRGPPPAGASASAAPAGVGRRRPGRDDGRGGRRAAASPDGAPADRCRCRMSGRRRRRRRRREAEP